MNQKLHIEAECLGLALGYEIIVSDLNRVYLCYSSRQSWFTQKKLVYLKKYVDYIRKNSYISKIYLNSN